VNATYVLLAPHPVLLQLTTTNVLVYEGTSLLFKCSATFTPVVNTNLSVMMEFKGPSNTATRISTALSVIRYEATYFIQNITSNQSGNYSCSAIADGVSIIQSKSVTSNFITLTTSKNNFVL